VSFKRKLLKIKWALPPKVQEWAGKPVQWAHNGAGLRRKLVCWVAIDHFTKPDPGFRHVDQHDEILINPSFKKKV
jgi:hypothetical protein